MKNGRRPFLSSRRGSSQRGFSLVETIISSGVLGLGLVSLTNLYTASADVVQNSRSTVTATQIARRRAERLAATAVLPNCLGLGGCKAQQDELAPELGQDGAFQCTQYVNEEEIVDSSNRGSIDSRYRIDTEVAPHPDPFQGAGAQQLTVSVCWMGKHMDENGRGLVHQVQVRKLVFTN